MLNKAWLTDPRRRVNLIIGLLLVAATVAVYWQVCDFDFVNLDDDCYVYGNPAVQAGLTSGSVRWALTAQCASLWHPLTLMSYMVDTGVAKQFCASFCADLGKHNSGVYHLTNLLFHLANSVLLFMVLLRLTGLRWRSAFVAALFAVHPLHAESVAWVSERKDVLSTFFWMLTTLAYISYARTSALRKYLVALAMFVLGLLSKPMLVTLPLTLLLLDYWPLNRFRTSGLPSRTVLIEKLPLLVLAGCLSVVTLATQRVAGSVAPLYTYPVGMRVANAVVAYVVYIRQMLWPVGLACLYPHPGSALPAWEVIASGAALLGITSVAVRSVRRRPYAMVGWLWYLITLVPVIGLVQVGKQAMADRYTYVPLIGLFVIVAWGVPDLVWGLTPGGKVSYRKVRIGLLAMSAAAIIAACMVLCCTQVGYWRDSVTLFRHCVSVTPRNTVAHENLGVALHARGDTEEAEAQFRLAVTADPENFSALYDLANVLLDQGKNAEAQNCYMQVLRLHPCHSEAANNLGTALAREGNIPEAIKRLRQAVCIDPNNANARANLDALTAASRQRTR